MIAILDRVALALFMAATVILATEMADNNINKLIIGILVVTVWLFAIFWHDENG